MIKKLFLKYGWLKTLRGTTLESYFTFNIFIFLVPECHELITEIIIIKGAILDSLNFHILPHLNNSIFGKSNFYQKIKYSKYLEHKIEILQN